MRKFFIYSKQARTKAPIRDLKKDGRYDILFHSIISALFNSNNFRKDVEIHLFLMGKPNPPVHIKISYNEKNTISKKSLKKLFEICLRKVKKDKQIEAHPGVFVDNKEIEKVLQNEKTKNIFILKNSKLHIKNLEKKDLENPIFILGDNEGFDKKFKKQNKNIKKISLGETIYFTSQSILILNYELDNLF